MAKIYGHTHSLFIQRWNCIAELYEECQTIFNDDAVVVIGTSLSNLFE